MDGGLGACRAAGAKKYHFHTKNTIQSAQKTNKTSKKIWKMLVLKEGDLCVLKSRVFFLEKRPLKTISLRLRPQAIKTAEMNVSHKIRGDILRHFFSETNFSLKKSTLCKTFFQNPSKSFKSKTLQNP